jgi:type II secretory pathway pseudopilin PulG
MSYRVGKGFTLIEMAIMLAVIGLVVVAAGRTIGPVLDSRKGEATMKRMDIVQQALQLYIIRNGCLPCPTNGALASTNAAAGLATSLAGVTYTTPGGVPGAVRCSSDCQITNATLPWRDLGISEAEVVDGWGNRIRYMVAGAATNSCGATAPKVTDTDGMVRDGISCFPQGALLATNYYYICTRGRSHDGGRLRPKRHAREAKY